MKGGAAPQAGNKCLHLVLGRQGAHLEGTRHNLGQQVYIGIQKGPTWDISTVIPHPIVVDARNGPWSTQAPVFSLSSLFGERKQKNWQLLMVFGVLKSSGDTPKVRTNVSRARTSPVCLEFCLTIKCVCGTARLNWLYSDQGLPPVRTLVSRL